MIVSVSLILNNELFYLGCQSVINGCLECHLSIFSKIIECGKCENGLFLLKENQTLVILVVNLALEKQLIMVGLMHFKWKSLHLRRNFKPASVLIHFQSLFQQGANPHSTAQNVRPSIQLTVYNVMIQQVRNLLQLEI
ncbi:UNKNOWN [Stylonychia lemnae]|uniref:Uncharacterized protein n=1 Tax=Stylonychia lemnae TaxID=5949 RepID=A0A078AQW5_STYLE|nr:UNKNOWN [Stylonychia lemnae]|eukprot:CDW83632.1 UNKNOWN [Stylonychia lemnae]